MRVWIALFGLLFQLLLPLVHPAAAVAGHVAVPADAVLLCTAQGMAAPTPDADDNTKPYACPDCDLGLPPLAPPPHAGPALPGPTLIQAADPLPTQQPILRNQTETHPGQARAPPPTV